MRLTKKQAKAMGIPLGGEGASARMQPTTPDAQKRRTTARQRLQAGQLEQVAFRALCRAHGLPVPETEYPFAKELGRQWRFDFLWEGWLAVEKVGGVWGSGEKCPACGRQKGGHHSRGQDQIDDMEKYNHAALLGYQVLYFTPQQFESGEAFAFIKRVLDHPEEQP